jgi:hypothetical protein
MRQEKGGAAGVAQHEVLAKRGMAIVHAVHYRNFEGNLAVPKSHGERLPAGNCIGARVHQLKLSIIAGAGLVVAVK